MTARPRREKGTGSWDTVTKNGITYYRYRKKYDGMTSRKEFVARTKADVKRKIQEFESKNMHITNRDYLKMTLGEWLEYYRLLNCLKPTSYTWYEQRFMLSNNILDPKVYQVTKVTDLNPSGVIKYSIKQDELDNKRDNVELQICDYYTDSGDQKTETIQKPQMMITESQIRWLTLNDDGELEPIYDKSKQCLYLGKNSYFEYKLPYQDLKSEWNLSVYDRKNELSDEDKSYYEGLMKITVMDNVTISIKPGKANSLIGKRFILSATDNNGDNHSSIVLEVEKWSET